MDPTRPVARIGEIKVIQEIVESLLEIRSLGIGCIVAEHKLGIAADLATHMSDTDFDCTVVEETQADAAIDPFTVLFVPLFDVNGNLQFHFDQPHKNKGP